MATQNIDQDVLLDIAQRYKAEQAEKRAWPNTVFHYHDKNPDAPAHIKLLESFNRTVTTNQVAANQKLTAPLGMLLILRALLMDANTQGDVYNDLVEKLNLDQTIEKLVQKQFPNIHFDLKDPKFLKVANEAIQVASEIINNILGSLIGGEFSNNFATHLKGIISAELDYNQRLMVSEDAAPMKP